LVIEAVDEAVNAAGRALEKAKLAVGALLLSDGKLSVAALDQHQHEAHGLAWLATYVDTLKALAAFAAKLSAQGKLGEIEQFMNDTQSFVNSVDLQNGVYEEDALDKLKEWETRSANLLEGGSGKTKFRISSVGDSPEDVNTLDDESSEPKTQSAYAELFNK
jgi:hypothetical protein